MTIAVGINGFGTIGKRVASAVEAQPDMTVVGVTKTRPNAEARSAVERNHPLFVAGGTDPDEFRASGIDPRGTIEELVERAEVMVDATPSGIGERNAPLYERHGVPAVFQGGEDATLADASFVARESYETVRENRDEIDSVRVVSCNTTGLTRLLAPLDEFWGVEKARVTLVRRGGDPTDANRGPIDDILPDPPSIPSHHGPDVTEVIDVDIDTVALKVPATRMHVHSVNVTLADPPTATAIRTRLRDEPRVALLPGGFDLESCARILDFAADLDRPRGDFWENAVWAESITVSGSDLYCLQAIHQESDVVPENVDAVRALAGDVDGPTSRQRTDEAMGIGLPPLDPVDGGPGR